MHRNGKWLLPEFGGAGTRIDRNVLGASADSTTGAYADHASDADSVLGDNGNLYRLVMTISQAPGTAFLTFNYDSTLDINSDAANPSAGQSRGPVRIVPRAYQLLDYTYAVQGRLLDPGEVFLFTSAGVSTGTPTNWNQVYQTVVTYTDTSGAGLTPGFVHDPVGTPNSFADNIFTGGGSKDVNGIAQWQWKTQMPQDKDDIADAFGASLTDAGTGHSLLFTGLDRYAANGNTTVGFWFFQQTVSANSAGKFSGIHTDGDLLLVVNFTVGGSNPIVAAYRWTGTDAKGTLTALNPPAGSTFANVSAGAVTVPWSFIDKYGFTSPQAGELLTAGVDLTALFGANVPHYVSFLAETRSSSSTNSTLSDFALGTVNTIGITYKVKPGPYSNTATVTGVDQGTNVRISASSTSCHVGVAPGPQLAATLPTKPLVGVEPLTLAQLQPIVVEALARWATLTNLPALTLQDVHIAIADLPDGGAGQLPVLGYTTDTVLIDANAGGFGWFIDETPGDDSEFAGTGSVNYLTATAASPAFGRMDLLTVVMHELGHVYGLEDLPAAQDAHELMATDLVPGERRLPYWGKFVAGSQQPAANSPAPEQEAGSDVGQAVPSLSPDKQLPSQPRLLPGHDDLPLTPKASVAVVAALLTPQDRPPATASISAFAAPAQGTVTLSSPVVVSGAVLAGPRVQTQAAPGLLPADLALRAVIPGKRPDWQAADQMEVRPGNSSRREVADRQTLDAVFTNLGQAKPPQHDSAARSPSLPNSDAWLLELNEEMVAELARFWEDGSSAQGRSGRNARSGRASG